MRSFNFKAKIIGNEKYLTYTMGEETELDEDVLDYCEENELKELVRIIYEEDDDYDYLTYDISGKTSIEDFAGKEVKCEKLLLILRNIANSLISLKEQAVKLNYILLNRQFVFVNEACDVEFICLPIESESAVVSEFKSFIRQLLANLRYDVTEDLSYVGKLLTYINGDAFNLRGLVGLSEALMQEQGISFEESEGIEADGVEVMNSEEVAVDTVAAETESVKGFMDSLGEGGDEPLPEIGDDDLDEETAPILDEADEELESILPAGMKLGDEPTEAIMDDEAVAETGELKTETESVAEPVAEPVVEPVAKTVEDTLKTETAELKKSAEKLTDEELIKSRIKALTGDKSGPTLKKEDTFKDEKEMDEFLESKPPVIKKNTVKVNRAAIIQNIAASEEEMAENENAAQEEGKVPTIDEAVSAPKKPKSNSILSKTVDAMTSKTATTNVVNIAKAIPYLKRVNTKEIIMLNKETFKIGKASRGVDYTVGGNGAISRLHAIILRKDDVSYIKDNKSTNHTYVNGKMVGEGEEIILTHDSIVKLGDEEFVFKIR